MKSLFTILSALSALALGACSSTGSSSQAAAPVTPAAPAMQAPTYHKAKADMESKSGSKAKGTIMFEETADGTKVSYDLTGLVASKDHGFHVHEKGDCSSKDAKSAGPHYMNLNKPPGTSVENATAFAGDLPMIKADAKGNAKGEFTTKAFSIDHDHPVKDLAIIVHGGPDDVKKKAPPRIACGIIKQDAM